MTWVSRVRLNYISIIEISRVMVGAFTFLRFYDALGASLIIGDPTFKMFMLGTLILSSAYIVGLAVPMVSIALVLLHSYFYTLMSLSNQVTVILLFALFFMGAGKYHSLDSILFRYFPDWKNIYRFSIVESLESRIHIQKISIFLYWGITITAMFWHLEEPFWLKGQVLPALLSMPYMNDFAPTFKIWFLTLPNFWQAFLAIALYVQAIWELILFPLFLVKRLRWFVIVQGIGFFVLCQLFVNLSYLPVMEIVMWFLLFYPARYETDRTDFERDTSLFGKSSILIKIVVSFYIVITLMASVFQSRQALTFLVRYQKVFLIFAQDIVNVFNKTDIGMGTYNIVIAQVDGASGKVVRVLPYYDFRGGRLDYLRNDILYFHKSLAWQRSTKERVIVGNGKDAKLTPYSRYLVNEFIAYDICLNREKFISEADSLKYKIYYLTRELEKQGAMYLWSSSKLESVFSFEFDPKPLFRAPECYATYRANWGHANTEQRILETLNFLESPKKSKEN